MIQRTEGVITEEALAQSISTLFLENFLIIKEETLL
jgi:hypothetical protein